MGGTPLMLGLMPAPPDEAKAGMVSTPLAQQAAQSINCPS